MEKSESKINIILKIAPWISVLSIVSFILNVILSHGVSRTLTINTFFTVSIVVANFIVVKSYFTHNKNTMKALIGFVLSGMVMLTMYIAFANSYASMVHMVSKIALFAVVVIFTINQILLSSNHYSRPVVLFINQILMISASVISLWTVIYAAININRMTLFDMLALSLCVIPTMFIVLKIEMNVNEFKVKREANGYVFIKSQTNDDLLEEEDMFISNKLFYFLPWVEVIGLVALLGFTAGYIGEITNVYSARYLFFIIKTICLFSTVHSYKSHNKNVMKFMNGFLLGMLLFENIYEISFIRTFDVESLLTVIMLVVNIVFLVAHLQLTRTHASKSSVVKIMKAFYVTYAAVATSVAFGLIVYVFAADIKAFYVLSPVIWVIGYLPVVTCILTIDTRVNGFKIKRERK